MARQQSKRRRKRYQPGSAYAGDVRPTGILNVLTSPQTIRAIFVLMALALVVGGGAAIFSTNLFRTTGAGGGQSFVDPGDTVESAEPRPGDVETRQFSAPPEMSIDTGKRYTATIRTELGDIEVELLDDQAPATVNNFVFLAREGFYDGLDFHHVTQGFSAQAGDPTGRGDGGPGYAFDQEGPGPFETGTLGMVNGSQFFIALTASDQFEQFTPFGRIVSGIDVAEGLTIGTQIQTIEVQES